MTRRALLTAILASIIACGESPPPPPPTAQPATGPGVLEGGLVCDAGDEAFVRRAIPHLWGRRPHSIREVEVLLRVVQTSGRRRLLQRMMFSLEFAEHWRGIISDGLLVNRFGKRANGACTGDPLGGHRLELAEHIRDNPPDGIAANTWNMTDLLFSAIELDDLSVVFRANLFAMVGSRLFDADDDKEELTWRRFYATAFERAYLNRRSECLGCHNSQYSVTGNSDPALDRTWELPGQVEKAIFGQSEGRAPADLDAFFRVKGVLSMTFDPDGAEDFWVRGPGARPWGMATGCGQFTARDDVTPDPLGGNGWFIAERGPTASIWDIEALLHAGFDALREDGLVVAQDGTVAGEPALAWLVSMRFAETVWETVTGRRLTTPHSFPRNRYQRDVLQTLTDAFVDNGFSLKAVLLETLMHPYLNGAPGADCGAPAYHLAPLFDPWVIDAEIVAQRLNSGGDLAGRLPSRTIKRSADIAMGWTGDEALSPLAVYETGVGYLLSDIGVFTQDGETGFRGSSFREALAWEEAYGACADPYPKNAGDPDAIDAILSAAQPQHTLEDAIIALKDRLLTEPSIAEAGERALLEALAGPLSTPLTAAAEAPLRRVCAALLASPQFQLEPPGPNQAGSAPRLIAPGTSKPELCNALAHELYEHDEAGCDTEGNLFIAVD